VEQILIKSNVGEGERLVRFALGAAAATGALAAQNGAIKPMLAGLGVFGILTALTRYCPVNHALGINHGQAAYRAFPHYLRRL
jgi:Protein of unknown function (DUF2892)